MEAKKLLGLLMPGSIINVPEVGDGEDEQNEDWWINNAGGVPPSSIPAGVYVCVVNSWLSDASGVIRPDAEVELFGYGWNVLNLYKIED